jgi:hypothetical protein
VRTRCIGKDLAAADQEIYEMVAQGVVDRMPVNLCSGTALGKRILDDFGENGIGTIGYEKNLVGKINGLNSAVRT